MTARDALVVDVLVVGLGPAGASAAAAAARAGARVLAFDRRKQAGSPVQCAEFAPALLGSSAIRASFRQPISAMTTFVETDAPHVADAFRGTMIDRAAFDRALCEAAERQGAELAFGVALEALDADGVAALSDGRRVRARVVIGADGPRSKVGAAIGAVNRELLETRQFAAPLADPSFSTDIYLSRDFPGGYAWFFPKGEVANIGLGVAPAARHQLKALLEALRARFLAEGRIGAEILGFTGGPIPVGGALPPVGLLGATTALLAGDAAGLVNPITGAGIPAAVVSGEMAGAAAATGAYETYAEDLEDQFGVSLRRALGRREAMMRAFRRASPPTPSELRASWIAFPEYWAA